MLVAKRGGHALEIEEVPASRHQPEYLVLCNRMNHSKSYQWCTLLGCEGVLELAMLLHSDLGHRVESQCVHLRLERLVGRVVLHSYINSAPSTKDLQAACTPHRWTRCDLSHRVRQIGAVDCQPDQRVALVGGTRASEKRFGNFLLPRRGLACCRDRLRLEIPAPDTVGLG